MFNALLGVLQVVCSLIIFITGVTWICDSLPLWKMSFRFCVRLIADALVTAAACIQVFRPTDPYLCLMLLGVTIGFMTHREVNWFRWVWSGFNATHYSGTDRRREAR